MTQSPRSCSAQPLGITHGPAAFADKIARGTIKDPDQIATVGFRRGFKALMLTLVTMPWKLIGLGIEVKPEFRSDDACIDGLARTKVGDDNMAVFALDVDSDKIKAGDDSNLIATIKRLMRWAGFDGLTYAEGRSNMLNVLSRGARSLGVLVKNTVNMIKLPFPTDVPFTWTVTGNGWIMAAAVGSTDVWVFDISEYIESGEGNWKTGYKAASPIKRLSKCYGADYNTFSISCNNEINEVKIAGGQIETLQTIDRADLAEDLRNLDVGGNSVGGDTTTFYSADTAYVFGNDSLEGTQFQASFRWSQSTTGGQDRGVKGGDDKSAQATA
jgi:hypothetical protein